MTTIYDFTLEKLGAEELPLADFEGKVILLVNVASECGLTPQYTALQDNYERYKSKGFVVIGVPCNQFAGQEPGTDEEILEFCDTNYSITFPLSGKIDVNGDGRDPLYEWLAGNEAEFSGDITWNFEKFLINREGEVEARFSPKVSPEDDELVAAIEKLL